MTNNQCSMCVGFTRGRWWLITLLGLGILLLLANSSRHALVESDLKHRITNHLAAENIDWISVELDGRGRDVLLTGNAPFAESRNLVIEMVKDIYGVRVVDDQLIIKPSISSSELTIKRENGTVLLAGRLASQASIDTLVSAAKKTYGKDNVVDELILSGQVKTADWLEATTGLLPGLVSTKTASLRISDNERLLTAEVKSHGERLMLVSEAKKLLGKNLNSKGIVVVPSESARDLKNAAETQIVAALENPMLESCQSKLDAGVNDGKVQFAFNTADLHSASYSLLNQIIIVLEEECNELVSKIGLTIAGHTDSLGDDDYNLTLSQKRADTVRAYLIDANADVGSISSVGYGESQPVASNDTAIGRTQNRRIEFKIERI